MASFGWPARSGAAARLSAWSTWPAGSTGWWRSTTGSPTPSTTCPSRSRTAGPTCSRTERPEHCHLHCHDEGTDATVALEVTMHPRSVSSTQNDRNALLLETGLALASELSLPLVLQRIVEAAAKVTGARYGALGVLGKDGLLVDFITTGISAHQRAQIGHLPVGRGILGILIREAHPLRLADLTQDPRSVGFPPNHPPMRSFLGAPVTAHGLVYGNLYLTEKQDAAEFDAEDERVLTVLAAQAGVAVANARLYDEAQRRAQRLEALREVTATILRGATLEAALELVARRARELAEADLAIISVTGADASPAAAGGAAPVSGSLVRTAASGYLAERLHGLWVPIEGSLSGEIGRASC